MSNFYQRSGTGRLYQNPSTVQNSDFDITATNIPVTVRDDPTYDTYRKYADGTTQGRFLSAGTLRSAGIALTSNVSVNLGSISIPANSIWRLSGMGGWSLAATTTVSNYALSVSKTSATLSGLDTIAFPTAGEVRYQFDGAGTIQTGGTFNTALPTFVYENDTNAAVTLYLVLRCVFGVSTVSGYGSFQAVSIL